MMLISFLKSKQKLSPQSIWITSKEGDIYHAPFLEYNILIHTVMCYLKNLAQQQGKFDFDDFLSKGQESSKQEVIEEENVLMPCSQKYFTSCWSQDQQKLIQLFSIMEKNNSMIATLSQILGNKSENVRKSSFLNEQQLQIIETEKQLVKSEEVQLRKSTTPTKLIQKIFGVQSYRYKLKTTQKFPDILYKERNFNLNLILVDQKGAIQRNSNILNLCFALANQNGEWIFENRVGEPFMKGKTQIELIKGEGEFKKIYPRDVSRSHQGGKLNIIIYSKPSTLMYSNSNGQQLVVSDSQIEPLLIKDITIKAKKKD